MNQKKAKALRRACRAITRMDRKLSENNHMHYGKLVSTHRPSSNKWPARVVMHHDLYTLKRIPVNHYRAAKRLYRGDVLDAANAALREALFYHSTGLYIHV